jgi:small subunit ribosomal protein S6
MNNYETVFILTPVLSDKQTKEAVDKFTKSLKNSGAKINHEEAWGLKKLAYPIQKKIYRFLLFNRISSRRRCNKKL